MPLPEKTLRSRLARALAPFWHPGLYLLAGLFLFAGGIGVALGSWQNLCARCPSIAQIRTFEAEQTSKLLSRTGELIVELGHERRTPISINSLPPHVTQAVIAMEDKRFYEHRGFDLRGIARAVLGVVTGRNRGGGSTITQQLARNMWDVQVGFKREYTRKLKELQVALELERSYTKDQILEWYLNEVYMGRGYGYQSASLGYFGKPAREVNVAEAALLAALLKGPSYYNPYTHPERTRSRRNLVLDAMATDGYLTPEEAERWKVYPLPEEDHGTDGLHGPAPYFEEWVRQILDSRYGEQVYRGGLRVYTTLDLDVQKAAVEAMEWGWDRIEGLPNYTREPYSAFDTVSSFATNETPYLQGALVAVDPRTGHVLALIGGRDFGQSKFDRARQAQRQAGSSIKPFVYTAAIASGIPASHIVEDQPVVLPQVDGTEWVPKNFGGEFSGPITIREGLRLSVNMVAIKLGWFEVGIETVRQTARRMGITTTIEPYPSSTIGAVEVRPIELVEAYASLATLGMRTHPFPILRVENSAGEVIWEPQPERTRAVDSLVARIMVDMLQQAANAGTGNWHHTPLYDSPDPRVLDRDGGGTHVRIATAGKTGTTNDGTNVWFAGFTPNLAATVWMGMDRPQPIAENPQATGGIYASPVWGRFLDNVYHGIPGDSTEAVADADEPRAGARAANGHYGPSQGAFADGEGDPRVWAGGALPIPEPWPIPVGLTTRQVDAVTGKLWSAWCEDPEEQRQYTELYLPGTEPTEYCDDAGIFRIPRIRRR